MSAKYDSMRRVGLVRLLTRLIGVATVIALSVAVAGCGDLAQQSRSPVIPVLMNLQTAPGFDRDQLNNFLNSDVITVRRNVPTVFNDFGRAFFRIVLKDQGYPGLATSPSQLHQVTLNRYRVRYVRADGRNREGVDVPYAFDSGLTLTIPPTDAVVVEFELVRHIAKVEPPLSALVNSGVIISTIAEVTFYGHDQAGNAVSVMGTVGVAFGNFGDPVD